MAAKIDIPIQPVEKPILCSPNEAPSAYWQYDRTTGDASKIAGRRPSRYWYKTKDSAGHAAGQLTLELSEGQDDFHMVNQIREGVARWRDSNFEWLSVGHEFITRSRCRPGRRSDLSVVGTSLRRSVGAVLLHSQWLMRTATSMAMDGLYGFPADRAAVGPRVYR